jgi:hypothetical protein
MNIIYFGNRQPGTYDVMVDCDNSCINNYVLNLSCGDFCGDGHQFWGEPCDLSVKDTTEDNFTAIPYYRCKDCEIFDFRFTEAVGCKYYDYCEDGMNVTDVANFESGKIVFSQIKPCCNDTKGPAPCCSVGINPEKNCSVTGAVRNISVTASLEYCYNRGYFIPDMTDKCIDWDYAKHTVISYC